MELRKWLWFAHMEEKWPKSCLVKYTNFPEKASYEFIKDFFDAKMLLQKHLCFKFKLILGESKKGKLNALQK